MLHESALEEVRADITILGARGRRSAEAGCAPVQAGLRKKRITDVKS